jgi:hypothetical protein
MKDEKSQLVSEAMSFCSPMASFIRAEEIAPIGQLQFEDTVMDVDGQEKDNIFEEEVNDEEKIETKETDFQDSRGSLETEEQCSLETLSESFEELDISVLEHFVGIPDFNLPIDSKYPFVAHTPCGYHCTDGWGLVEAAIAAGRSSITCHVKYLKDHSEDELAMRKAAGRIKPEAGIASYGETVRNVKYLERRLLANSDLKVFCHGGARRGDVFTNNTEDNLRKVLSIRLGRSVTTINLFLNHGAFLSDETLNFLASENTVKEFFEKAQAAKRTLITAMKGNRVSDEDITAQISRKMVDWHGEYNLTGKITPVWNSSETNTETGSERRSISTRSPRNHQVPKPEAIRDSDADDAFDDDIEPLQEPTEAEIMEEVLSNPKVVDTLEEQGDSTLEQHEDSDSFEKVKSDTEELAQRLLAAVTLDDPELFYEQIVEEVAFLHRISLRARVFGKEAAI